MSRIVRVGWYVHPSRLGGQEHFALRLAACLRASGVEVLALFGGEGAVVRVFEERGIPCRVFRLDESFGEGFGDLAAALTELELDLVQTNLYSPVAALAAEGAGLPRLWRVGGHPEISLRRLAPSARSAHLAMLASHFDAVVCNSRFVATAFGELSSAEPDVIPNGVGPLESFAPRRRKRSADSPPIVTVLARLDPQKRQEDLVRAAGALHRARPGAQFRLVGPMEEDPLLGGYRRDLEALIRELGLEGVVEIAGATATPLRELERSSVFVLPSLGESCSNALLEAMALGLPVVVADSGGHRELVDDGVEGLLVPPRSPDALAAAIGRLLDDAALARRLGERARSRVRARHDLQDCARAYMELYERLVAEGPARRGSRRSALAP